MQVPFLACLAAVLVFAPTVRSQDIRWICAKGMSIHYNNVRVYTKVSSIEDCQQKCVDETSGVCHGIDYSSDKNRCALNAISLAEAVANDKYISNPDYDYCEWVDLNDRIKWACTENKIIHYNNVKVYTKVKSVEDCQKKCLDETSGVCHGIDYSSEKNRCALDAITSAEAGDDFISNPEYDYCEWYDHIKWTCAEGMSIYYENVRVYTKVRSIEDCQKKCVDEKSGVCHGIDYSSAKNRCALNAISLAEAKANDKYISNPDYDYCELSIGTGPHLE